MELIHTRLELLGRPAAAYIPAGEMTAFFGKADYQSNLLTGITNLLSGGSKVDISTKGSWLARGGPSLIMEPTLTMHLGSTVEWLHKGMPEGTLEGGFMGRFLICCEELDTRRRQVPIVKSGRSREEIQQLRECLGNWKEGLELIVAACRVPQEMLLLQDAEDAYANWYYNRFRLFSRAVMPYANRSRDMVLRLAMLSALSRFHDRYIEEEDVRFACQMMQEVADRIDRVVLPPSVEAQVGQKVLELLPATMGEIYASLGMRYSLKAIEPAVDLLRRSGKIRQTAGGVIRVEGED